MAASGVHLVAHEVCELGHVRQVLRPLLRALWRPVARMAARAHGEVKGIRRRRWRAISLAMTTERERRRRAMKKARASVADRAPMRRDRRSARPSAGGGVHVSG